MNSKIIIRLYLLSLLITGSCFAMDFLDGERSVKELGFFRQTLISIGEKDYPVSVSTHLFNICQTNLSMRDKVRTALEKLVSSHPSPKVVGFNLVRDGDDVVAERFLGENAK